MNVDQVSLSAAVGHSFLDREGQRWWVRGARPGSEGQYIVEARLKGSYERVALYVMTDQEFRARASAEGLKPEGGRPLRTRPADGRPQAR
jgi:hypothetical protein